MKQFIVDDAFFVPPDVEHQLKQNVITFCSRSCLSVKAKPFPFVPDIDVMAPFFSTSNNLGQKRHNADFCCFCYTPNSNSFMKNLLQKIVKSYVFHNACTEKNIKFT